VVRLHRDSYKVPNGCSIIKGKTRIVFQLSNSKEQKQVGA